MLGMLCLTHGLQPTRLLHPWDFPCKSTGVGGHCLLPYLCTSLPTGDGALEIDGDGARLDSFIINDAAQRVLGEGGEPLQILCGPGQARVISNEFKERLQVLRSDDRRGAYVDRKSVV